MLNSQSIGNKIASARKKSNLSQAELAQQVSLSSQAIGKWERGESQPDITTLNRLAEILGVDLNYFSEKFQSPLAGLSTESMTIPVAKTPGHVKNKKINWDMSKLNLVDSDFSGLNNLHEKFSSSNIQRCLFVGSDISSILLQNNNVDGCDFSDSDMSKSRIVNSILGNNKFRNCSLRNSEIYECLLNECDFSGADFTGASFKSSAMSNIVLENAILNRTSFTEMQIQDVIFEGHIEDCFFEDCTFHGVKFENATLVNTFFKNNRKFKRVQFVNCKVDKLTFAFLKNNLANMTGIGLLTELHKQ